jgi:hypothetical protein
MIERKYIIILVVVVIIIVSVVGMFLLKKKKKYSCKEGKCVLDFNGPYKNSNCDNKCLIGNSFAFACSPGLGCHKVNEAPNNANGTYSNMLDCNSNCKYPTPPNPMGTFAFACSPGVGCYKVNEAPNNANGTYSNMLDCNTNCLKPTPPKAFVSLY